MPIGEDGSVIYAEAQFAHGDHSSFVRLAVEPRFGAVFRMGFTPRLAEEEDPVVPVTVEQLRAFATAARRLADDWEASRGGR